MEWKINIDNLLGGFAPNWYRETYPIYGNKNQAGAMTNIDMTNAGFITQGPGLTTLTNGDQDGVVTTLIKGMTRGALSETDRYYGVGGNKIYVFGGTTANNSGWPLTLDKAGTTTESLEDIEYYRGALYATYSHDAVGDVARIDVGLSPTVDPDYMSTVPVGATTLDGNSTFYTPRQLCVGRNETLYFASRRYVSSFDNTGTSTLVAQALDVGFSRVVESLVWAQDRLWVAVNHSRLNPDIRNKQGSILVWDGTTDSWEKEILLGGKVGALYCKEDVVYVFWQDNGSFDTYYLGYVNGDGVTKLAQYTGTLPRYYQVSEYQNFVIWVSDNVVNAWGSGNDTLPVKLFQLCDGGHSTVGGLANPLGTPVIASTDDSSEFKIASFDAYTTDSSWKSMLFDITGQKRSAAVNTIRINFDELASGARVDWTLRDNKGTALYTDTVSYAKLGAATTAWYNLNGKIMENFRIEFDFANGSTTVPVKLKSIQIYGTN